MENNIELTKGYGDRIRQIRKINKLSQTEFGKNIYCGQDHISNIEKERKIPHDRTLEVICAKYMINKTWLYNGEGGMYLDITKNIKIDNERTKNLLDKMMDLSERDFEIMEHLLDSIVVKSMNNK